MNRIMVNKFKLENALELEIKLVFEYLLTRTLPKQFIEFMINKELHK
jgi:hypothetical protein